MDEVEAFAIGSTCPLAKGDSLPKAERDEIVRKLAEYTGLSETYHPAGEHAPVRRPVQQGTAARTPGRWGVWTRAQGHRSRGGR